MHDPFAMRPFFGYNFGDYIQHWLSMQDKPGLKLPKIYHVNWFRKGDDGKFLWPGFGENARVLDWVLRRVSGEDCARETPIGMVPTSDSINTSGLQEKVDMHKLFDLPKDFWKEECKAIRKYFDEQVNVDLPAAIRSELDSLEKRVNAM